MSLKHTHSTAGDRLPKAGRGVGAEVVLLRIRSTVSAIRYSTGAGFGHKQQEPTTTWPPASSSLLLLLLLLLLPPPPLSSLCSPAPAPASSANGTTIIIAVTAIAIVDPIVGVVIFYRLLSIGAVTAGHGNLARHPGWPAIATGPPRLTLTCSTSAPCAKTDGMILILILISISHHTAVGQARYFALPGRNLFRSLVLSAAF